MVYVRVGSLCAAIIGTRAVILFTRWGESLSMRHSNCGGRRRAPLNWALLLPKTEPSMSMLKEFKEFAMRGSVIDLAVGVVIGGAFGKIVSSLVADIIMPLLGELTGGVDFSSLALTLHAAADGKPSVLLSYGKFIQSIFTFVIIAFAIFWMVKAINDLTRKPAPPAAPPAPPEPSAEEKLLGEIRDLLKARD